MPHSEHVYNIAILQSFILDRGLSHREFCAACGITEKHLGNVFAGRTRMARAKVRRKFIDGLRKLNADERIVLNAFLVIQGP